MFSVRIFILCGVLDRYNRFIMWFCGVKQAVYLYVFAQMPLLLHSICSLPPSVCVIFLLASLRLSFPSPLSIPRSLSGSSERAQVLRYRSQDT